MNELFDNGYRYHSNMQARANWRLLFARRVSNDLRSRLFVKWNTPNRRGYRAVSQIKYDARIHVLWRCK